MTKHYFMFFDSTKMPVAVFLTETQGEAIDFFEILYQETWAKSLTKGISCVEESEVAVSEWERIHQEYAKRKERLEKIKKPVLVKPKELDDWTPPIQIASVSLETARYMNS